jgi:hypothetical protein
MNKQAIMQRIAAIAFILTILLNSCRRENLSNKCNNLEEGLSANDPSKVAAALNTFLTDLPSSDYNESTINLLCKHISSTCHSNAELICFDCIKTLPTQSEIRIQYSSGGSTLAKTIDLTYTPSHKIIFRNLHD